MECIHGAMRLQCPIHQGGISEKFSLLQDRLIDASLCRKAWNGFPEPLFMPQISDIDNGLVTVPVQPETIRCRQS